MSGTGLPTTFAAVLRDLVGQFVQLGLAYGVADLPGATFPVGRLEFVGSDYFAISHVLINRHPLVAPLIFVTLGQVQSVHCVRPDQIVLEVGLGLDGGPPPC